jgi:hypothetical protein
MSDKVADINTAALKKLADIKREQDRLRTFCRKADEMKGKVDESVYARVIDDYARRDAEFEKRAASLRSDARKEYEKLRRQYDDLKAACDEARLNKEELDLRHAVGEFGEKKLAQLLREPKRLLEQCQADFTEVDALKARFLEVFGSEEDLETDPEATVLSSDATAPSSPTPAAGKKPEASASEDDDATNPAEPDAGDQTLLVPQAVLVANEEAGQEMEYHLGAVNYIGRSKDNQIPLSAEGVSGKHALLGLSAKGFMLSDLRSRNGTYLNGERITEHPLTDGDRIEIGTARLTFRSQPTPTD